MNQVKTDGEKREQINEWSGKKGIWLDDFALGEMHKVKAAGDTVSDSHGMNNNNKNE